MNLKNKIKLLENEILHLKDINKELKEDTKNHLKIIKTLSEGEIIDPPWQTVCSKNAPTSKKTYQQQDKDIDLYNSFGNLEIQDIILSSDSDIETSQRKNRKPRSIRIKIEKNRIKHDNRYVNKNNVNSYRTSKLVPGNRTYADATKFGKKVVVFGDSHLNRINRRLFDKSLVNCKSLLKCFNGGNSE